MPGRSQRSARLVIMDDVDWSDPVPRRRRDAVDLTPPSWVAYEEAPVGLTDRDQRSGPDPHARREWEIERRRDAIPQVRDELPTGHGFHVEDYVADLDLVAGLDLDGEGPVIEYVSEPDPERVWGPRPRLMPAATGGRRTVVITGHAADRQFVPRPVGARSSSLGTSRGFHAGDRTAMWAVLLGVMLLIVAISSAH
jgi:hypothetical protein